MSATTHPIDLEPIVTAPTDGQTFSELEAAIKAPANPDYHPSVQEALTRWAETRQDGAQGERGGA